MSRLRLDKFISSTINTTRSGARDILKSGLVCVNSVPVKNGSTIIDASSDTVTYYGKTLSYSQFVYIMQNKPQGVVSASESPGDVTVIDILPDTLKRKNLFPAGRLDKDTTGFVLITDDGEFAHNILSPAHHVEKTYIVTLLHEPTESDIQRITSGIVINGEQFKPAKLIPLEPVNGNPVMEIKITEGRYHQIKRTFAATGNKVVGLKRISIGALNLDETLLPGQSREITPEELSLIKG